MHNIEVIVGDKVCGVDIDRPYEFLLMLRGHGIVATMVEEQDVQATVEIVSLKGGHFSRQIASTKMDHPRRSIAKVTAKSNGPVTVYHIIALEDEIDEAVAEVEDEIENGNVRIGERIISGRIKTEQHEHRYEDVTIERIYTVAADPSGEIHDVTYTPAINIGELRIQETPSHVDGLITVTITEEALRSVDETLGRLYLRHP
jgi:hypothetical protein